MAEEGQRGGYSRLAGDEEVATASGGGAALRRAEAEAARLRAAAQAQPLVRTPSSSSSAILISFALAAIRAVVDPFRFSWPDHPSELAVDRGAEMIGFGRVLCRCLRVY